MYKIHAYAVLQLVKMFFQMHRDAKAEVDKLRCTRLTKVTDDMGGVEDVPGHVGDKRRIKCVPDLGNTFKKKKRHSGVT